MDAGGWVLLGCALGAAAGLLVPALLRRLPDSVPEVPWAHVPPHASLADRARLGPALAAVGAVTGGLLGWRVDAPWPLAVWWAVIPVALLLAYVDWHTSLLPRVVVVPATLASIAVVAVVELVGDGTGRLVSALVTMLVVRTVHWLLWFIHAAGLGFGDVRLSALLGLLLGLLGTGPAVVGVYAAFLLHGIPGLVVAIVRRDRKFLKHGVPFGPAMMAGALLGACWGAPIWSSLAGG